MMDKLPESAYKTVSSAEERGAKLVADLYIEYRRLDIPGYRINFENHKDEFLKLYKMLSSRGIDPIDYFDYLRSLYGASAYVNVACSAKAVKGFYAKHPKSRDWEREILWAQNQLRDESEQTSIEMSIEYLSNQVSPVDSYAFGRVEELSEEGSYVDEALIEKAQRAWLFLPERAKELYKAYYPGVDFSELGH